jgi:hypothetical protein
MNTIYSLELFLSNTIVLVFSCIVIDRFTRREGSHLNGSTQIQLFRVILWEKLYYSDVRLSFLPFPNLFSLSRNNDQKARPSSIQELVMAALYHSLHANIAINVVLHSFFQLSRSDFLTFLFTDICITLESICIHVNNFKILYTF